MRTIFAGKILRLHAAKIGEEGRKMDKKIIRDNIVSIITGDYEKGKVDLNTLGNPALLRIDRTITASGKKKHPALSRKQKRAARRYYSPYVRFLTDRYHRIYTGMSGGKFYPEYIPEELYLMYIDRYFCDREEARFLDNKCYYYRLFSNIRLPEPVGMRIGGSYLDKSLGLVSYEKLLELAKKEPGEIVVKPAVGTEGGFGVHFLHESNREELGGILKKLPGDVVIQRALKQHPAFAELHRESVNTFRIVSLLAGSQVKIYAVCLKIGVGSSRVDNGCSGGIYCGVGPDGRLGEIGSLDNGDIVYAHPDLGYRFSDQKVPGVKKAVKLVREAHAFMGHFRLVSWDVAIDEAGEAVLIEANLTMGGIVNVQACTGPLFGKDTRKLLDEAFRGKRRRWTSLW